MSRRRSAAPSLVVISWRDIPAQVTTAGVEPAAKAMLPNRFQVAIDRAAKVAGMTERSEYIARWRRSTRPLEGDPEQAVAALVEQLDREHDREALAALVRQGGVHDPLPDDAQPNAGASTGTPRDQYGGRP